MCVCVRGVCEIAACACVCVYFAVCRGARGVAHARVYVFVDIALLRDECYILKGQTL